MANNLAQALLNIQRKVPELQRNSFNEYHGNRYVTLDKVWETVASLLNEEDCIWTTRPTTLDGKPALYYKLVHAPSGDVEDDTMLLMLAKDNPTGQGSAITYARRYALVALLNLVVDSDDDGAAAEPSALPPPTQTPAPQAAPTKDELTQLRQTIAELSGQLAEEFPDEWQKAIAWANERSIALGNPADDKLRVIERALRRKLDTCRAAKAKTSDAKPPEEGSGDAPTAEEPASTKPPKSIKTPTAATKPDSGS